MFCSVLGSVGGGVQPTLNIYFFSFCSFLCFSADDHMVNDILAGVVDQVRVKIGMDFNAALECRIYELLAQVW